MTLCPVAIAVGCRKCPLFSVCPAKTLLGDQPREDAAPPKPAAPKARSGAKRK